MDSTFDLDHLLPISNIKLDSDISVRASSSCDLSPVLPQTQSSPPGFASLPTELLYLILKPLRQGKFVIQPGTEAYCSSRIIAAHQQAFRRFADLRLVCSMFNQAVTPIAYQEIVLSLCATTGVERIMGIFECGANHVRSMIIYSELLCGKRRIPMEIGAAISRGLGICTRINNLECYGDHNTFTNRRWLARTAPCTITSLTFCPATPGDLSRSLIRLGPYIERLEIRNWPHRELPFHLPSEMTHLAEIVIRGGRPNPEHLKELLVRALNIRASKSARVSSLHSLSLLAVYLPSPNLMESISTIGLGSQLTSLRMYFLSWQEPHFHAAIPVLKTCRKLINFSFMSVGDRELFDYLPPTLQCLELLASPMYGPLADRIVCLASDFITCIASRKCPALRTLSVVKRHSMHPLFRFDEGLLQATCDRFDVHLDISHERD